MSALLAAALLALAACPAARAEGATGPRAEARCALEERPAAAATVDPARLDELLSRPRYARARERASGAWKAYSDRFLAWLESLLETSQAQSYSEATRFVVLVVAAALAAAGALRVLGRTRRRPCEVAAAPAGALVLEAPAEHLARARAALAASPREAIREGLLALLSALEDARLARPDRVRTNLELVRELPGRGAPPSVVGRVEPLMRWYDAAFYSLDPVPPDGAARFVDEVARLSSELGPAA